MTRFSGSLEKNMAMKYNLTYLPGANRNLLEIDEYLSQFYPSTPAKFFSELDEKIELLKEHPYMCPKYIYNEKYRRLVVGDYLLFYTVDDDNNEILIHRILHGSQDITQHL